MSARASLFHNLFRFKTREARKSRYRKRQIFLEGLENRVVLDHQGLAVAFVDVDGDDQFTTNDTLIAEIIDTNDSGFVDAGDTARFGALPTAQDCGLVGCDDFTPPQSTAQTAFTEGTLTFGLAFDTGISQRVNTFVSFPGASGTSQFQFDVFYDTGNPSVNIAERLGYPNSAITDTFDGTGGDQSLHGGTATGHAFSDIPVHNFIDNGAGPQGNVALVTNDDFLDIIFGGHVPGGTVLNQPPEINDQSFSIDENSDNTTVVGTAAATDPDLPGDTLTWAIIGGNAGGAFDIDSGNGEITVANKSALDFETTPVFNLTVQVEDAAGETDDATIMVNLNDLQATLSINDVSVVEGNAGPAALGFTLSVSGDAVNVPFSVNYNSADDSAVEAVGGAGSDDYDTASGAANFAGTSASETQLVNVTVNGDTVVELDETLAVVLSGVAGTNDVTILDSTGVGTIENDDSTAISVGDASVVEGGNLEFPVSLSNPVDVDTEITYSTGDDTATTADSDYTGQTAQTITILAGQTSGTITVATTDDNKVELDETITLGVDSFDMDGRDGALAVSGVLFENDFDSPTAWVPRIGVFDVDTIGPNIVYAGQGAFGGIPSVDSIWIDGTNGTYSDPSGIGGDYFLALLEGPTTGGFGGRETVTLTLSHGGSNFLNTSFNLSPSSLSFDGTTAAYAGFVTAPTMQVSVWEEAGFNPGAFNIDSSGTLLDQVIVTGNAPLNPQSSELLISNWSSHIAGLDVSSAAGANVVLEFDLIDGTYGAMDNLLVAAANAPGVFSSGSEGTILNNDSATISIDDVSQSETDGATTFTFDVSLSAPVDAPVAATVDTADGSAVEGGAGVGDDDYEAISGGSVSFAAGATSATIDVTVNGDNAFEPDENFFVSLSTIVAGGRDVTFADAGGEGTIENDDSGPVADASGPYVIDEGDSLTLDASASTDADDGFADLTFRWDVDGDGDFDENITGSTPTLTLAQLTALGLADGPHTNTVTVEASDGTNVDTADTTLTINNVAPTITSFTSSNPDPHSKSTNGEVTISGSFTDPAGDFDTHTVEVDWGDGSPVESISVDQTLDTFAGTHAYAAGGIYTITVTAIDSDGGASVSHTTTAVTQGVGLVDGVLYVIGTDARDKIHIGKRHGDIVVRTKLHVEGRRHFSFDPADISSIVVYGCDGNDRIHVSHRIGLPSTIYGGGGHDDIRTGHGDDTIEGGAGNDWINSDGGNDTIIDLEGNNKIWSGSGDDSVTTGPGNDWIGGGDGNDVILAGAGNDHINGGRGNDIIFAGAGHDFIRAGHGNDIVNGGDGNDCIHGDRGDDLLIGGTGRDYMHGGRGDDLMIASSTASGNDIASLESALANWTAGDLAAALVDLGAITDDGDKDVVKGDKGDDELFGGVGDKLKP